MWQTAIAFVQTPPATSHARKGDDPDSIIELITFVTLVFPAAFKRDFEEEEVIKDVTLDM